MVETSRRQNRKEVSSEGGQEPEGAVAPQMDEWMEYCCHVKKFFKDDQLVINGTWVACMTYGRNEKNTSLNHKIRSNENAWKT